MQGTLGAACHMKGKDIETNFVNTLKATGLVNTDVKPPNFGETN
jgi:hypothetical protein